jgi:hypothetical protein
MKKSIQCATWVSRRYIPKIIFVCPGAKSTRAESAQQTNSKLMKNKPDNLKDICDLSAKAERAVFDGTIRQTLKKVESNVVAPEAGRPADARCARCDFSVRQHEPRQKRACFRCPYRLGRASIGCG